MLPGAQSQTRTSINQTQIETQPFPEFEELIRELEELEEKWRQREDEPKIDVFTLAGEMIVAVEHVDHGLEGFECFDRSDIAGRWRACGKVVKDIDEALDLVATLTSILPTVDYVYFGIGVDRPLLPDGIGIEMIIFESDRVVVIDSAGFEHIF